MEKKNNILILTYWSFDEGLIQAYTIPYIRIIKKLNPENNSITLVTLEKNHSDTKRVEKYYDSDFQVLPLPYFPFGAKAIFKWVKNIGILKKFIQKEKINSIHSWCTPAGMIGYILHKKTGVRLVADSFEPHAEAMIENGTWKKNSAAFKILFSYEKKIAKHADKIICIAPGMQDYIREKYHVELKQVQIKPACVDLEQFSFKDKKNIQLVNSLELQDKIVCLYAGKFGGIYLEKEVFDYFKSAYSFWKDKLKIILLTNEDNLKLKELVKYSEVPDSVFILKFVAHKDIANYMGLADFAICPVKTVPTKKYCSPIKNGEYWALGLPVIITKNISNDSEIIEKNKAGYVWKEISEKEFKNSIIEIDKLLKENTGEQLYSKIRPLAEMFRNFKSAEKIYKEIYC